MVTRSSAFLLGLLLPAMLKGALADRREASSVMMHGTGDKKVCSDYRTDYPNWCALTRAAALGGVVPGFTSAQRCMVEYYEDHKHCLWGQSSLGGFWCGVACLPPGLLAHADVMCGSSDPACSWHRIGGKGDKEATLVDDPEVRGGGDVSPLCSS
jgi:hypothetical protein